MRTVISLMGAALCAGCLIAPAPTPSTTSAASPSSTSGTTHSPSGSSTARPTSGTSTSGSSGTTSVHTSSISSTSTSSSGSTACEPIAGTCASDSECCSGHCGQTYQCLTTLPPTCHSDADCTVAGTECEICSGLCVFLPGLYCDSEAPCTCGYSCQSNNCSPLTTSPLSCTRNTDCLNGSFCNATLGQCQIPQFMTAELIAGQPGAGCGLGLPACPIEQVCSDYQGECQRPCATNADCLAGSTCAQVTVTVDGGVATTLLCQGVATVTCNTTADCPSTEYACETNHQCMPRGC